MTANKTVREYYNKLTEMEKYFSSLAEKKAIAYDSKSEKWKEESEKASEELEAIETLQEISVDLSNTISYLEVLYEDL